MIIEFNNVSMTYKPGIHALKNVSFRIEDGEFVFIIGRSGSGKSTLVKLLTCEERPTSGSVFIDAFEISSLKRSLVPFLRRNIGMVFQDFRLIQTRTVYQNVAFAMEIVGATNALIRHRVPMVLSTVGLRDKANMLPGQLSGGEQQRVAIARAMVNNPTLLLADEPTGNLDPINSESIMALLKEINETGTTVLICTHDATMVNKLKRRVLEISDGFLVRDDVLGEYNLSSEIRTKAKTPRSGTEDNRRREHGRDTAAVPSSPLVRNINIKFSELGVGLAEDPPDRKYEAEAPERPSGDDRTTSNSKGIRRVIFPWNHEEDLPSVPQKNEASGDPSIPAATDRSDDVETGTGSKTGTEQRDGSLEAAEPIVKRAREIEPLWDVQGAQKAESARTGTSAQETESGKDRQTAEAVKDEPELTDKPDDSTVSSDGGKDEQEEAIRIAVEYYMKKARKMQNNTETVGRPDFFDFGTASGGNDAVAGDTPENGVRDDFIQQIKPRRIREDRMPEENP